MSWDAIGAIGELVGALVVVILVVYLSIQLRQSNRHAEASSEVAWFDGWNSVLNGWISDEITMTAIRAGFRDFDQLSKSQQAIFHMRIGAMVNHWVLTRNLHEKGLLSKDLSEASLPYPTSCRGGLQMTFDDSTPDQSSAIFRQGRRGHNVRSDRP